MPPPSQDVVSFVVSCTEEASERRPVSETPLASRGNRQLSELDAFEASLQKSVASNLPCCVPNSDIRVRRRKRGRGRMLSEGGSDVCAYEYAVDVYVRSNVSTSAIFDSVSSAEFASSLTADLNVSYVLVVDASG